jgi:hypothetical protein
MAGHCKSCAAWRLQFTGSFERLMVNDLPKMSARLLADATSERWIAYYAQARRRRRATGRRDLTTLAFQQWRRRQRLMLVAGAAAIGALVAASYWAL